MGHVDYSCTSTQRYTSESPYGDPILCVPLRMFARDAQIHPQRHLPEFQFTPKFILLISKNLLAR